MEVFNVYFIKSYEETLEEINIIGTYHYPANHTNPFVYQLKTHFKKEKLTTEKIIQYFENFSR